MYRLLLMIKNMKLYILNPHFMICFGISWLITNGWAYIGAAAGHFLKAEWLTGVSSAWLAFLWLPFTPEKLITMMISVVLLRLLFPHDQKTMKVLSAMREKLKRKSGTILETDPEN